MLSCWIGGLIDAWRDLFRASDAVNIFVCSNIRPSPKTFVGPYVAKTQRFKQKMGTLKLKKNVLISSDEREMICNCALVFCVMFSCKACMRDILLQGVHGSNIEQT